MKRLLVCGLMITCLSIPFLDKPQSAHLRSECVEFKSCRSIYYEYLVKYKEVEIQKEIQRQIEEQERLRLEELERQRIEEERIREEINKIYCKFEVSFYTTAEDEGGHLGANGDVLQPWVSIATPKDIPFYSNVYIEGLGEFEVMDTGSYIKWATDNEGNKVCRVDICVNTKEEAMRLGRYYAYGYIDLNK